MTAKNVSIGAPFGWLMRALDVGRRNPRALFGGFALMLAVGLVPSLIQFGGDALGTPSSPAWIAAYALSVAVSLAIMPPLMGAAFRLLHLCESGLPVRATDIFDGYRLTGFGRRMVLLALAFVAVYVAAFAVLYAVLPGKDVVIEMFRRALATPPGGQPDFSGLGRPPGGLFLWFVGSMLALLVLGNAYMLAFARAALDGRGVGAAFGDGFAAAFRNLLPFVAFAVAAAFVGFVALLLASVVIGLVIFVLSLASTALAMAVAAVLYLLLMLAVYVVMFGFYYHAWREVFPGGGHAPPADAPDATLAA